MTTAGKKLGIWMDNAHAHVTEYILDPMTTTIITSKSTHEEKAHSANKSEQLAHNKEQQHQSAYYKELSSIIKEYDSVVLFGPTTAKTELHNLLKADPLFGKVTIKVKEEDRMTENQEHAFIRNYFTA